MVTHSLHAEWSAIAARIDGLCSAGKLYYLSIQKSSDGSGGVEKAVLLPESVEIYGCLESYYESYGRMLPEQAAESLADFLTDNRDRFLPGDSGITDPSYIRLRLVALASLKARMDYHLANVQHQVRLTVERAFLHLQHCIAVDSAFRDRWKTAYASGETECEKLGAVHLLWHGIWAFKAYANGGRTDLVTQERIDSPSATEMIERTSLGMVLTEWKKATTSSDVADRYEQGIRQASQYSSGALAGTELRDTRYIVVVAQDSVDPLQPRLLDGVVYRLIVLVVDPTVPSVAARKA